MKYFVYILCIFTAFGCQNNSAGTEKADSSYKAITDTSTTTKDSLPIPDSTAHNVTH